MTNLHEKCKPVGSRLGRRALLRGLAVAVPLTLLAPHKAFAAPSWSGHFSIGQKTGQWLKTPTGRAHHVMVWPKDSEMFPPPPGWVSADRTEVLLKAPGTYRLDWKVTYIPGGGTTRKTAAEFWDGSWGDLGDGNQLVPCKGEETTLLGFAFCVSDGTNRVRILDQQDSGKPLATSDREYECSFSVTSMPGVAA